MTTTPADPDIAPPEARTDPSALRDPATVRREQLARLRRRRKRLMLVGLPFALLALLLAAKFASMLVIGNRTVATYTEGDYEGALNSAQQQKLVNLFEPWKAPYNTGTVYLQLGLNPEARLELEGALSLASGADQCPVRSNLAIAIERIGDAELAAGDPDAARTTWEAALAVLEAAPPECPQSSSSDPMADTDERLRAKLDPPEGGEGGEGGEDDPKPGEAGEDSPTGDADPSQIDQIGNQLEENQHDRDDQITENNNQNAGGGGTDTPW